MFQHQYFLSILILFEGVTAALFILMLLVGGFYNLVYLPGLGLLFLMFGGLELAIAILLFTLIV